MTMRRLLGGMLAVLLVSGVVSAASENGPNVDSGGREYRLLSRGALSGAAEEFGTRDGHREKYVSIETGTNE